MMLPAGYQMRLGTPADFAAVRAFYNQLIDDMEHLPHHPMWDKEGHPSDAYLRSALAGGELWIAECGNEVAGALIVNHAANGGYYSVPWKVEAAEGEYSIVHAFGVSMRHRGIGLGSAMMRFVIARARQAGEKALRLDLIDLNKPAEKVYLQLGFYKCCEIELFYPEVDWQLFHMYELAL